MSDTDDLVKLRDRILLPFQIRRGSNVWAPWGVSGWSAIEVVTPSRKWAKGYRVKPATNERGPQGKVPLDRLLKRDPSLKGKDKPEHTPDEVFAHVVKESPPEPKKPVEERPAPPPEPVKPLSEKEQRKRMKKLLDMFADGTTTSDW